MNKRIPNIGNLHFEKNVKEQARNEIFTIVLNKCIDKIVETNHLTDKTFLYFEVPNIIMGFPSYDKLTCVHYLIQKFTEEKYKVEFVDPVYLYIDWSTNIYKTKTQKLDSLIMQNVIPTSNPNKLKEQTKELLKKYPDTTKITFEYENQKENSTLKKNNKKKK